MRPAARTSRLLIVTVLAAGPMWAAPSAAAVTPPPPDDSWLPAAGPPTPSRPTAQHDDCVAAPPGSPAPADPGQLVGMDFPAVWALSRGAGQTVAVIDTGVARHRLLPHLVPGGDYVSTHDGTADCDGHGTILAGIIGAARDSPDANATADRQVFTGIAPDVSILAIRQSSNKFRAVDEPAASGFGDVETLARAVRTAADLGATVINISSVACVPADAELDDRALGAALAYAVDVKNVVVVTAAGNVDGHGQCPGHNRPDRASWDDVTVLVSPAWYDDYVLTVGSVGPGGTASRFSLAGPWVDVAAPGEGIVSLAPAEDGLVSSRPGGAAISGTSYAAAVVSAIAALVRARSPELTARQVMERLEDTAHHPPGGWDAAVGRGTVDALAAVSDPGSTKLRRPSVPPIESEAETAQAVAEQRTERTAVQGAAICLALAASILVASAWVRRVRQRDEAVPGD